LLWIDHDLSYLSRVREEKFSSRPMVSVLREIVNRYVCGIYYKIDRQTGEMLEHQLSSVFCYTATFRRSECNKNKLVKSQSY
jgi:hypothetical protein